MLSSLGPASGQKMPLQFETEAQQEAGIVEETRREEEGRGGGGAMCLQGCILIHSFALFSSAVFVWTIVALCIFSPWKRAEG